MIPRGAVHYRWFFRFCDGVFQGFDAKVSLHAVGARPCPPLVRGVANEGAIGPSPLATAERQLRTLRLNQSTPLIVCNKRLPGSGTNGFFVSSFWIISLTSGSALTTCPNSHDHPCLQGAEHQQEAPTAPHLSIPAKNVGNHPTQSGSPHTDASMCCRSKGAATTPTYPSIMVFCIWWRS